MQAPPTIGVFDSGFGGLTVLRALLPLIPGANYIYLGDTARLPYGSKSRETIARYAVSSAKFLHEQGADLLVIACNTATALALEDIQQAVPIPVIGVVEPGAQAALAASTASTASTASKKNGVILSAAPERAEGESNGAQSKDLHLSSAEAENSSVILSEARSAQSKDLRLPSAEAEKNSVILSAAQSAESKDLHLSFQPSPQVLVLATAATVQSHAYTRALHSLNLEAHEKACPLLVPLVEEGWINHPVTDEVLKIYLQEALAEAPNAQTLLLGCTHYPLLEPALRRTLATLNHSLTIIDSAESTAQATASLVAQRFPTLPTNAKSTCTFYATDSIEKFQRLGSAFLGQPVTAVRHLDLHE
jgi:glutamate racemase